MPTAFHEAIAHRVYGHTFPNPTDADYWDVLDSSLSGLNPLRCCHKIPLFLLLTLRPSHPVSDTLDAQKKKMTAGITLQFLLFPVAAMVVK